MFDPFLVLMGPLGALALFLALATVAIAAAAVDLLGRDTGLKSLWKPQCSRVAAYRSAAQSWLRAHSRTSAVAGLLETGRGWPWR